MIVENNREPKIVLCSTSHLRGHSSAKPVYCSTLMGPSPKWKHAVRPNSPSYYHGCKLLNCVLITSGMVLLIFCPQQSTSMTEIEFQILLDKTTGQFFLIFFFFNFAWIHLKSAWEKRKQQDFYLYTFFFLCMVGFNMYFWMLEWTVLLTVTFKKGFSENAAISSTESCSCSMQCSPRFLAPWPISDSLSHIQENLCSLGIFLWLTLDQISKFFVISCYTLLYI